LPFEALRSDDELLIGRPPSRAGDEKISVWMELWQWGFWARLRTNCEHAKSKQPVHGELQIRHKHYHEMTVATAFNVG
jgi:hypothetical protein